MKKPHLVLLLLAVLFLSGSDIYEPYSDYKPIFMYRADMENAVQLHQPRTIENPGKIYLKDDYIFVNEKYSGVHIINNSNPINPVKIGFLQIDGCIDMAMKGNVLYADNAVDLIAVKFGQEYNSAEVTERVRNVFPELRSPDGWYIPWEVEQARPENSIVVKWIKN